MLFRSCHRLRRAHPHTPGGQRPPRPSPRPPHARHRKKYDRQRKSLVSIASATASPFSERPFPHFPALSRTSGSRLASKGALRWKVSLVPNACSTMVRSSILLMDDSNLTNVNLGVWVLVRRGCRHPVEVFWALRATHRSRYRLQRHYRCLRWSSRRCD